MKLGNRYIKCLCVAMVMALVPHANAAYPNKMNVKVEVWNSVGEELALTHASWLPLGTDLSPYVIPADLGNAEFSITLGNARNDSAAFRLSSAGKVCEFKMSHEATFSWLSIRPTPEKSASSKSVGQVPVECRASVIQGTNSLSEYTVRVVMRHITR